MSDQTPISLTSASLRLQLRPKIGGSISQFTWTKAGREVPVFRGAQGDESIVLDMGSFPLVPWVNRVRDRGFEFRGRRIALSPESAIDPSPLHGHGWLSPWTVEFVSPSKARLRFDHSAGEWPWSYSARQDFTLDESGLSILLSCTNTSDTAMPCGLGHHPYFHCGPDTRIDTKVDCTWTIDELVLPVEKVPAEGRFSMSNRLVCAQQLDHGFGGWGGRARISDPDWPFRIEFSSPTARFFQLYSPPEGGFFVAEPVTHANTAMNAPEEDWPDLGMEVLEPGHTMVLETRFDVIEL
jgi:aldose 1-epimerase